MNRWTFSQLAPPILALLLVAGRSDGCRPTEQAERDSVLIDGFSSIIVTNMDSFVVADDILGGEFDFIV